MLRMNLTFQHTGTGTFSPTASTFCAKQESRHTTLPNHPIPSPSPHPLRLSSHVYHVFHLSSHLPLSLNLSRARPTFLKHTKRLRLYNLHLLRAPSCLSALSPVPRTCGNSSNPQVLTMDRVNHHYPPASLGPKLLDLLQIQLSLANTVSSAHPAAETFVAPRAQRRASYPKSLQMRRPARTTLCQICLWR